MPSELERLDEIEKREKAATAGPWVYDGDRITDGEDGDDICTCMCEHDSIDRRNAQFIAHARADVPWLLALVRGLQSERDGLRKALELLGDEDELPDESLLVWDSSRWPQPAHLDEIKTFNKIRAALKEGATQK